MALPLNNYEQGILHASRTNIIAIDNEFSKDYYDLLHMLIYTLADAKVRVYCLYLQCEEVIGSDGRKKKEYCKLKCDEFKRVIEELIAKLWEREKEVVNALEQTILTPPKEVSYE